MAELFSQLMTPQLIIALVLVIILFVGLYVLSILWVARDAALRNADWKKWSLIAVIPIAGIIAYCFLRPPLLQIDQTEQELEIAVKQRELMKYGECARCGYPVDSDFVMCPNCHQKLKNICPVCKRALDLSWNACPYCTSVVQNGGVAPRSGRRSRTSQPHAAAPLSREHNMRSRLS